LTGGLMIRSSYWVIGSKNCSNSCTKRRMSLSDSASSFSRSSSMVIGVFCIVTFKCANFSTMMFNFVLMKSEKIIFDT